MKKNWFPSTFFFSLQSVVKRFGSPICLPNASSPLPKQQLTFRTKLKMIYEQAFCFVSFFFCRVFLSVANFFSQRFVATTEERENCLHRLSPKVICRACENTFSTDGSKSVEDNALGVDLWIASEFKVDGKTIKLAYGGGWDERRDGKALCGEVF